MLLIMIAFSEHSALLKVEETEIDGFDADQQTFFAGNTENNQILQITPRGVRLICAR